MMGMKEAPLCSLLTRAHSGSCLFEGWLYYTELYFDDVGWLLEAVSRAPVSAHCKWFKAVRSEWFVETDSSYKAPQSS
jgi:hypothetical protein